jgi:hypothetical protein
MPSIKNNLDTESADIKRVPTPKPEQAKSIADKLQREADRRKNGSN